ncbi:aldehyde dehydrogenase [Nitratireductor sp. StC3]|nr:aldehyde dehydrogenase [Nitratireductor sp. StC3]
MNGDNGGPSRRSLLRRSGILAVTTPRPAGGQDTSEEDRFDIHVCLTDQGHIYGFSGKVDLGTGVRTALAQIVAEELDVPVSSVEMTLGDTENAPDQGGTIASETIETAGAALRSAAAQARRHLLSLAADVLDSGRDSLVTEEGTVRIRSDPARSVGYPELLQNRRIHLALDRATPTKDVSEYRIVGAAVHRTDIPDKAAGRFIYVHDVRVPGMLHGRVVRPPYAGLDSGKFIGGCLEGVDEASIAHIPGIVAVVTQGDFVGVVAEREEDAAEAALALRVRWKPWSYPNQLHDLEGALRAEHVQSRRLIDDGDVDAALASAEKRLDRTYVWPYHLHGSIGPSCAIADVQPDGITVWAAGQSPNWLRTDLALLTGLPEHKIRIIRHEAAGCYGRNCADDVAADAVLLAMAVGRPVRVQLTREQENLWDPRGSSQLIDISGALGPDGSLLAYDFQSRYPANLAPTLALLLTGKIEPVAAIDDRGDRTARPPYGYENLRVTIHDMAPIVRTGWIRGVAALPNVFAHESFIDELAVEADADPLDFRVRHLDDQRAIDLMKATAERAGWEYRAGPNPPHGDDDILRGRGIAQGRYVHGPWPGHPSAWSTWVAEVAVNRKTGEVDVTRLVVGQDTGMMINPAGVQHQIHGNVIQSTSRVLKERASFAETGTSVVREWGAYPILTFPELPAIEVVMMDRQYEPPLGAGESASIPSAAAIVNAVYDATGVRFREIPLTPERILAGLGQAERQKKKDGGRRGAFSFAAKAAGFLGLISFGTVALPIATPIVPIARPDPSIYSQATIERGEMLAGLGACAVCHTLPGGAWLAGGVALPTPFGTVMTTNITPDVETGIGGWSYSAFERAMRKGIHRDGYHLYPAFPYPSFAKTTEADLQALYAYLMAQPAVSQKNEDSRLTFPFNIRPLMSGWNLLFNRVDHIDPDPAHSAEWNRGRYLVDGLGHCGACHTPRNLFGAEKKGQSYLAGGVAEGWDAPALTNLSAAPVPWTEETLFLYLRTGASPHHGVAAGPMAPVIAELKTLPDSDLRAMATYLASLNTPATPAQATARRDAVVAATSTALHPPVSDAARLFDGACAACHEAERGPQLFNPGPPLGLNTNLHLNRPDNFLHVVLHGIEHTVHGAMPGFSNALDDRQISDLTRYARQRFAPDKEPWVGIEEAVKRVRAGH